MSRPRPHLVALALCAAAMLVSVARTLDPSLTLLSWDHEGHLLRARAFLNDMAGARALTSWFPYWHGGFPMTEVYPPLATWILALLTAAGVAEAGSRVLLAALWIGAIPVTYHVIRRFGVLPWPAALAACLVASLDSSRTFGAQAIYWLGLIPNATGFLLALLTLGEARLLFTDRPTLRQAALTGGLGGLTILAHPFCAYWTAMACLVLFLCETPGREGIRRRLELAAVAAAGAVAAGSFYWAPFVASRANVLVTDPFMGAGVVGAWKSLAMMRDAGGPLALALALAGFAALGTPGRRRTLAFFCVCGAATFALSLGAIPFVSGLFGPSQAGRFEGFYLWILLAVTAWGFESVLGSESSRVRFVGSTIAGTLVFLIIATGLSRQRTSAAVSPHSIEPDLASLAAETGTRLRTGDFILTENDRRPFRTAGSPHLLNQRLPSLNSNLWDVGGGLPEGTRGALTAFTISRGLQDLLPGSRETLQAHGVRFVATIRADSARALANVPWLIPVWSGEERANGLQLALFELAVPAGRLGLRPDLADDVSGVSYGAGEGYRIDFSSRIVARFPIETAISFHPWLVVTADASPVGAAATADGRLMLTSGPEEVKSIRIAYRPPGWISVVRILSLFCLLGLFSLVVAHRRAYP